MRVLAWCVANRASGWTFEWLGIPVQVKPEHFLIAALFGFIHHRFEVVSVLLYIPIVFTGVLVHEMGHALAGRRFGERPFIELNGWGGLTYWLQGREFSRGRSIFVSFAGPLVGIVIGSLVFGLNMSLPPETPTLVRVTLGDIVFVNLGWALFNLMPIYPLDGGKIVRDVFGHFVGSRGNAWSHASSVGVGVLLIALALLANQIFAVIMIGQLVYMNWQQLQQSGPLFKKKSKAAPEKASSPRAQTKKAHGFRVIDGGRKDDDEKPKYLN